MSATRSLRNLRRHYVAPAYRLQDAKRLKHVLRPHADWLVDALGRVRRVGDVRCAAPVSGRVNREPKPSGFWESIPARNKLKTEIRNVLLAQEFSLLPGLVRDRAHIVSRATRIAEKNNDIIPYAEWILMELECHLRTSASSLSESSSSQARSSIAA